MSSLHNSGMTPGHKAALVTKSQQIDLTHHKNPGSRVRLMRVCYSNLQTRGVTLIELITVVAIMAILLTVAVPSLTNLLDKKRIEGAHATLTTDLHYARSEAVQRNRSVRVTFGVGCYVIHTVGTTATSCTQSGAATIGTDATQLKLVQLDTSAAVSFSPNNSMTYLMFDSVRGMATWDGSNTAVGSVNVSSSAGLWLLRTSVTLVGRTQVCSPNSSIPNYSTCI